MNALIEKNIDQQKADQFGERMLEVLNSAGLALMISVGHRTGLFDVLAKMPPSTSHQIAEASGLNERYVREWLSAMVTGGVIEYDANAETYFLPAEHAEILTRNAPVANMASTMQWIPVLGQVEDQIVDCFRRGGGVHYGCYARFHEVMAEESAQTVVAALTDHILPLEPTLSKRLESGIDVVDVGCGSGQAMIHLASVFPNSRFTGVDFSQEAVAIGNQNAQARGLANVRFAARDAAHLSEHEQFDLVTAFDAIHDQAEPAKVLAEIFNALRRGGTFLMQDIATSSHLHKNQQHPVATFLYTISCMHCMTVSLAHGGAGLGTCWGEELACVMLKEAGFANVTVRKLDHDIMNNYYITHKT